MLAGYSIHPMADIFPMMSEDELHDLADDIATNGLLHPVIVQKNCNGILVIDGRNRLMACEIAGIEPSFHELDAAVDPVPFIVSANLERRNLTKGQRAMAMAMIYPEPKRGVHSELRNLTGAGRARLSQARAILHHSPALAESVLAGVEHFDKALEKVKTEQEEMQTDEAKLLTLCTHASDLADLVEEGRMKLPEAYAAYERRVRDAIQEEQNKREAIFRVTANTYVGAISWQAEDFVKAVMDRLDDEKFAAELVARVRINPEDIGKLGTGVAAMEKILKLLISRRSK
jgi:ParB-like nuclease domain